MKIQRRLLARTALCAVALGVSAPAHALFGEEDWMSGQNALLTEMVLNQLEELTRISTLIANVQLIVASTNDTLSLARQVKETYDMVTHYSLEKLVRDAKIGLHRAFPELVQTEREVDELLGNVEAAEKGEGTFFAHRGFHDPAVARAAHRTYAHLYQAAIWPAVFPEAMALNANPSPVDLLIQNRYRRTEETRKRAVQYTAMGVLAEKVKAFVADAEAKDNLELKALATETQINLQSMENLTELRNLAEQDAAMKEQGAIDTEAFHKGAAKGLEANVELLWKPAGIR